MNSFDRFDLLEKVQRTGNLDKDLFSLDSAIYSNLNCKHEFGIRNSRKKNCLCLDCGEPYGEECYKKIYSVPSKQELLEVRRRYLELLFDMNSKSCIDTLETERGLKLVRENIRY